MTTEERKPARRGAAVADRDEMTREGLPPAHRVICACTNMTFAQLEEAVGKVHSQSFDALLEETGAGKTCTACLLDLEYYFVDLKARAPRNADAGHVDATGETAAQRSWKYRVYGWLDSISPPVAWASPNHIPILAGKDIETWLTVTNHDLLFDERKSAPLTTTVEVRRADGSRLWRRRFRIPPGEELRVRVDEGIADQPGELAVGRATVVSRADHPAMRGTMRPQLEILAARGTCALHAQGDVGPGDTWFTMQNRPDDERLFLLLINTSGKGQSAEISYPHDAGTGDMQPEARTMLDLPAHGTGLHEVTLPPDAAAHVGALPFAVRARLQHPCRVYLVCATPALDRFSIDHR
ncbi:MAG: hypothetical protein CL566_04085 [Alphaproteobacteria bacterium]|nr:hypothetical protein [Alphaproteobacteria bacterium]